MQAGLESFSQGVRAEERLGELSFRGIDVQRTTRAGHVFVEIVRYATDKEIALIVMGTHGHGPVAHLLLGSVADKVGPEGGREACALDWQLFFNSTTDARFETRNEQYRIIGDTGIAYSEYSLSVNYNGQGTADRARGPLHDDLYSGRRRVAHRHAAQHSGRRGPAAGAQPCAARPAEAHAGAPSRTSER